MIPKKRRKRPAPVDHIWTRRSVMEWMGKGAVAVIGAELLAACGGTDQAAMPGVGGGVGAGAGGTGTGGTGGGTGGGSVEPCESTNGFLFEPGDKALAIFDNWNVRTVDSQNVASLLEDWALRIDGLVDEPMTLSFADLLQLPRQDQVVDFHCVEGWSIYDVPWNGVHLSTLLDLVGAQDSGSHLTFYSSGDVYTESLPLDEALEPKTLLAYGIGCLTLPLDHGFPLRVVMPRKFGYKSAKYVDRIEVTDKPITGYWEQYGYSYEADVPEHRLRPGKY